MMNSNRRKMVEKLKIAGLSPREAYKKMMETKPIGKRKTDSNGGPE